MRVIYYDFLFLFYFFVVARMKLYIYIDLIEYLIFVIVCNFFLFS